MQSLTLENSLTSDKAIRFSIFIYFHVYFAGARFQNFPRKCFRSKSTIRLKQMTVDIFIQDIN